LKYYKNTELARLYNISEKSVRNWILAAEDGKLDLQLYHEGNRTYIANISQNTELIKELVQKGKKYRNSRGFKVITPSPEFYNLYTQKQIFDIVTCMDIYRELPLQYSYVDGAAHYWDMYTEKLFTELGTNGLTSTIRLLGLSTEYLDTLLEGYEKVNIVDIGVGNCLPVKDLLKYFLDGNRLNRYIGIDISKDMLKIAERNIGEWFNGRIKFEGHVRDINYDRFDDLLLADSFNNGAGKTLNLILFVGGTIANLRDPNRALATIHDSMGKQDIFILTRKLDTEASRRYFDFTVTPKDISRDFRDFILGLLNIKDSYYTIDQFFDEATMTRKRQARLKVALTIKFQLDGKERAIELNKDESLLVWQASHQSALQLINQLDQNNLDLLQATKLKGQQALFISRIKAAPQTKPKAEISQNA
jgi:uncharacterized SAM-dependent methyltransferase